ncbi:YegS/Rv2252/BmrU family lipid kinase [Nocardioides sp. LMS-CY]|nr:YegS/Rv2252/BmrU family lipid kinase [Nocardioides sp. LMS-CY]
MRWAGSPARSVPPRSATPCVCASATWAERLAERPSVVYCSAVTGTRDIALLTNPTAGRGRGAKARDAALQRLREAGITPRTLQGRDPAEALDLAHQCVADGVETLVVVGGDGMVHLGVQATAGTSTALGLIPAGTGNDVARYFDLPRKDPRAATERLLAGAPRRIDLARSGDRYFLTVLAAGFDAIVNERANRMTWPRGQMRYNIATLAELRVFEPIPYTLDLDGESHHLEAMLVAVGNGPSFGGGLRITEGALLDDGLLDVVVIKPMSKTGLVRTYPKLFKGTHVTHPAYEHHRVHSVTVAAPGIVSYADGERFGALPLTVECVPGALTVIC